jgi:hypothetical protein
MLTYVCESRRLPTRMTANPGTVNPDVFRSSISTFSSCRIAAAIAFPSMIFSGGIVAAAVVVDDDLMILTSLLSLSLLADVVVLVVVPEVGVEADDINAVVGNVVAVIVVETQVLLVLTVTSWK